MLTGKRAFRKVSTAETMAAILNEDPPVVSQATQIPPPGIHKIVNRCLAKDPELRFQHASDLAFALEAFSDAASAPATVARTSSSKLVRLGIAAGLIVLAAALVSRWTRP